MLKTCVARVLRSAFWALALSPKVWAQTMTPAGVDESMGLPSWLGWVLLVLLALGVSLWLWQRKDQTQATDEILSDQALARRKSQSAALPQYNPKNVGNDASARPWEGASFEPRSNHSEQAASEVSNFSRFESQLVKPLQVKMPNFHPQASSPKANQSNSEVNASQNTFANTPWVRAHGAPHIDRQQFLAMAKSHFLSLQEAWDHHDLSRVHEFLSEEMFAQVQLQVQNLASSQTRATPPSEVMWLDAQWMGLDASADDLLANVELSGMVREGMNASATPFREIWTWKLLGTSESKPQHADLGHWVVCGLEPLQS